MLEEGWAGIRGDIGPGQLHEVSVHLVPHRMVGAHHQGAMQCSIHTLLALRTIRFPGASRLQPKSRETIVSFLNHAHLHTVRTGGCVPWYNLSGVHSEEVALAKIAERHQLHTPRPVRTFHHI